MGKNRYIYIGFSPIHDFRHPLGGLELSPVDGGRATVEKPETQEDVINPLSPWPCFVFVCLFVFLAGMCSRKLRGYASRFFEVF